MDNSSETEQDSNDAEDGLSTVRRPMNAFFIFCKRHRDIVREKYPHLENRSITKILGEWWANLDPSEKSLYTALAKQYKEAFMKAHPDFKWYKLPAPPARTLVTRPSNRCNQSEFTDSENCGITLGKLADDEQLGGLSSLINTTSSTHSSISMEHNSQHSPTMAEKGGDSLSKPPKKRYIINGEFQSDMESSSIEIRDCQTREACSALLELAEVCSSTASREISPVMSWPSNSISASAAIMDHRYSFPCTATSDASLPISLNISSNESTGQVTEDSQQDQPLDLCKNKEKNEVKETSKTITTSHQQLINHFVDKFLSKPVPPKFYESKIIDSSFCKMFSEKNLRVPSSKGKGSHSAFTLSVAIESAVDKAYSIDNSNSYNSKISDSNIVLDCLSSDKSESNSYLKVKKNLNDSITSFNLKNVKMGEKYSLWPSSFIQDKNNKDSNVSIPRDVNNSLHNIQMSKSADSSSPECSNKKYSNLWCNLFVNDNQGNSSEQYSPVSNGFISELPSDLSERRSSQRSCKGKRYQALLTEGLLQSHKERKQSCSKKLIPAPINVRNNFDTPTVISTKRKKESKNKPATEVYGIGESLFNLEEKIASLPKCSFENLNKRRKNLESNVDDMEPKNMNTLVNSTIENNMVEATKNPSIPSSGRYKTGNFDLEQQIAFLPKCNIEVLDKKNKKD